MPFSTDIVEILSETSAEKSADYASEHGLIELIETARNSPMIPRASSPVDTHNEPLEPNLVDLVRLHRLIRARRMTTVLEFGVGYSTLVMASALRMNQVAHAEAVRSLRRGNPFEVHCVDDVQEYVRLTAAMVPDDLEEHVFLHHSACEMGTFNGRVCTFYDQIPNICPDLVYLDGPSQHSVLGEVRGVSTRAIDRMPMSGDLLAIEHFLLPGTLVVIDGRTANARFLKANFQREWAYLSFEEADIHVFDLREDPLGKLNRRQLEHANGVTVDQTGRRQ